MVAWRHAAVVLGLVAGLGVPTPAAAADGSDTNRWRAHLGTDLGSWVRSVPWPHRIGGPSGSRDYLGVVGVKRLRLGGGLGHGFRDRFVVGMRLDYEISRGVQRSLVPNAEARAAWGLVSEAVARPSGPGAMAGHSSFSARVSAMVGSIL